MSSISISELSPNSKEERYSDVRTNHMDLYITNVYNSKMWKRQNVNIINIHNIKV